VPQGLRPTRGVETARGEAKDRTLSVDELRALAQALRRRQNATRAAAALRLIALTGLRREEACGLRWREVDYAGLHRAHDQRTSPIHAALNRRLAELTTALWPTREAIPAAPTLISRGGADPRREPSSTPSAPGP
jgi:integrase